jgi:hypothetical protein
MIVCGRVIENSRNVLVQYTTFVFLVKPINLVLLLFTFVMGEGRGMCRVLVGKPEGKRPLERLRCR